MATMTTRARAYLRSHLMEYAIMRLRATKYTIYTHYVYAARRHIAARQRGVEAKITDRPRQDLDDLSPHTTTALWAWTSSTAHMPRPADCRSWPTHLKACVRIMVGSWSALVGFPTKACCPPAWFFFSFPSLPFLFGSSFFASPPPLSPPQNGYPPLCTASYQISSDFDTSELLALGMRTKQAHLFSAPYPAPQYNRVSAV